MQPPLRLATPAARPRNPGPERHRPAPVFQQGRHRPRCGDSRSGPRFALFDEQASAKGVRSPSGGIERDGSEHKAKNPAAWIPDSIAGVNAQRQVALAVGPVSPDAGGPVPETGMHSDMVILLPCAGIGGGPDEQLFGSWPLNGQRRSSDRFAGRPDRTGSWPRVSARQAPREPLGHANPRPRAEDQGSSAPRSAPARWPGSHPFRQVPRMPTGPCKPEPRVCRDLHDEDLRRRRSLPEHEGPRPGVRRVPSFRWFFSSAVPGFPGHSGGACALQVAMRY